MNNKSEFIELLNQNTNTDKWEVVIGEETLGMLKRKNITGEWKHNLISETTEILALCGNPRKEKHQDTGLVFGYVQSGKTLSFTTLTTLARDNGYKMVIVLAGIKTNLINQSKTRLENDLGINVLGSSMVSYKNPEIKRDGHEINSKLKEWKYEKFKYNEKQTILITVMKEKNHLLKLIALLENIEIEGVPTLIIDDEADQASFDTNARKNAKNKANPLFDISKSTIHNLISELKAVIPHNTFIQYTATPQVNLFVDIFDILSPNFVILLSPGKTYTGGKVFFDEQKRELIRTIPENEIFGKKDNVPTTIPLSLLRALHMFFLGVASGRLRNLEKKQNRTMMIHPAKETITHSTYENWVKSTVENWITILQKDSEDNGKKDLLKQFGYSYQDLKNTVGDLESFEELSTELETSLIKTLPFIKSANSKKELGNETNVEWTKNYSHVLIGGEALNRGYTVEGLTVTYMPRSLGKIVKNPKEGDSKSRGFADTMQQRARFFGYKMDYIGFCRVFLEQDAIDAYEKYIYHEEDMRVRLIKHKNTGKTLNEFYRQVRLDSPLDLTANNRLSKDLKRDKLVDWFLIDKPYYNYDDVKHNQRVVEKFRDITQFTVSSKNENHYYTEIRIQELKSRLLDKMKFSNPKDCGNFESLINWFSNYASNNKNELCDLYIMLTKIKKTGEEKSRYRTLKKNGTIDYFPGTKDKTGERYYGTDDKICIQIHNFDLGKNKDEILFKNVPSLAIWIPKHLETNLIRWKEDE